MKKYFALLFYLMFIPLFVSGNRGEIPFDPDIKIFEPNQRAMIAWSGTEEILLLCTDLSASESTMVLEVLPVPSEPAVKKGDLETFRKATALINQKLRHAAAVGKRNGGDRAAEGPPPPAGEVTFHEKIGAHDISVTHLLNAEKFVDWVKEYLKTMGVEKDIISEEMHSLIEEYIADDFTWFVFDVITLKTETQTNEPIQYRFKTKSLYYPLKITKTAEGSTSVDLLILTPKLLRKFPGLPIRRVGLQHDPINITCEELKELDEDMYDLLMDNYEMKLRIWKIEGKLQSFDNDLIAN